MADRSMPSSFDEDKEYNETGFQKVTRKLREEPLIPLGALLTCLALYNAWRGIRKGDHAQVQRMFRARVGAQAFTVMAMVAGGAYYGADREKRKELVKLEAQQRAEERHQKWLKELEARDDEEKLVKEQMEKRREKLRARRAEESRKKADVGPEAEASTSPTVSADANASAAAKKEGSTILGAISDAGGWWGRKKEQTQPEAPEGGKKMDDEKNKK